MSKILKKDLLREDNSYQISQMKASIDSLIATHAADDDAHHAVYTEEITIHAMQMSGEAGFVKNRYYGASYSVLFSDVNAGLSKSWYVRDGGSFKVTMTHVGTGANNGKTAGGVLYMSYNKDLDGNQDWDISGANWDITLDNSQMITQQEYGTAITVGDNTYVGLLWLKDDNAGGAAGTMHVYGFTLKRQ